MSELVIQKCLFHENDNIFDVLNVTEIQLQNIPISEEKNSRQKRYSKFYPKRIIQKELSQNKSCEKYYPEVLSKNNFIQRLM